MLKIHKPILIYSILSTMLMWWHERHMTRTEKKKISMSELKMSATEKCKVSSPHYQLHSPNNSSIITSLFWCQAHQKLCYVIARSHTSKRRMYLRADRHLQYEAICVMFRWVEQAMFFWNAKVPKGMQDRVFSGRWSAPLSHPTWHQASDGFCA